MGPKTPNLCIFGLEFENIFCHVSYQRPRICLVAKLGAKIKILKFRTKNALFGYFWAGIWKTLFSYLKSALSNSSNCKFLKKTKMSKFGTKDVWFGYFWAGIWKQHPRICVIAKYNEIIKMPKFGTKSALFGYFWATILKNYCHIWNQHLWISVTAKLVKKQKCLNLGQKKPYLGIFDQKCFVWVFLGKNFEKTNFEKKFWNQHSQLSLFAKFSEKTKNV